MSRCEESAGFTVENRGRTVTRLACSTIDSLTTVKIALAFPGKFEQIRRLFAVAGKATADHAKKWRRQADSRLYGNCLGYNPWKDVTRKRLPKHAVNPHITGSFCDFRVGKRCNQDDRYLRAESTQLRGKCESGGFRHSLIDDETVDVL